MILNPVIADNFEVNKKFVFEEALNKIFLSYVNDNFDFYKNVTQGEQQDFIKEILYQNFKVKYGKVSL